VLSTQAPATGWLRPATVSELRPLTQPLDGSSFSDQGVFNGQHGDDHMRCEPYEIEVRSSLPAPSE
jgi:hypothetical protein